MNYFNTLKKEAILSFNHSISFTIGHEVQGAIKNPSKALKPIIEYMSKTYGGTTIEHMVIKRAWACL